MKNFFNLLQDAYAFIIDKEARTVSNFKYPSGQPMSVRAAKKSGLM
jgi:hypothetical protein